MNSYIDNSTELYKGPLHESIDVYVHSKKPAELIERSISYDNTSHSITSNRKIS